MCFNFKIWLICIIVMNCSCVDSLLIIFVRQFQYKEFKRCRFKKKILIFLVDIRKIGNFGRLSFDDVDR